MVSSDVPSKKTESIINEIKSSMDYVEEATFNYLSMKTSGALMLTGDWGSGKTFYVKNKLFRQIETKSDYTPIIVSLYGVTDRVSIAKRIVFTFFDKKGSVNNLSTARIVRNLKKLSEAVPILNKYVNVEKIIASTEDNLFSLLPHENLFICFDDIERKSEDLNTNDFLGLVNDLVENKNSKVLLIANEEKIKDGIEFKEKTIEKTIQFAPDISQILDELINSYEVGRFKDYLIENKEYIVTTLGKEFQNNTIKGELKKSFSNIRTLKFAIEHFRISFSNVSRELDLEDKIVKKILKNIWTFTLAISAEFKKPNSITYTKRNELDKRYSSGVSDQVTEIMFPDTKNIKYSDESLKKWSYRKKIEDIYFKRINEIYIFYKEIYKLITSGRSINTIEFISDLKYQYQLEQNKVNPAYDLLNEFMRTGWWNFSDAEFPKKLSDLLQYVENGEFKEIMSYVNSGTYIFGFKEFLNRPEQEVIDAFKIGIDKLFDNKNYEYSSAFIFQTLTGEYHTDHLLEITCYIKEKLAIVKNANYIEEVTNLGELLGNNIKSFIKEFSGNSSEFKTPEQPILHLIDKTVIDQAVLNWQPNEILDLSSFISKRYIESGFLDKISIEIEFLDNLESSINKLNLSEVTLSNYTFKEFLLKGISKAKKVLEMKP